MASGGGVGVVDGDLLQEVAYGGGVEGSAAADEEPDGDGEGLYVVEFHHEEGEAADDGDVLVVDEADEEFGIVACGRGGYGDGCSAEECAEDFLNEYVYYAG